MIDARVFREGQEMTDLPVDTLSDVRAEADTLVWVDVTDGSDEEITRIGEEFTVHPLAVEDLRQRHQRPKVDDYDRHLLLVVYGSEAAVEGRPMALHELAVVSGENFLLTFHGVPPIDAETVAKRIRAHPELAHQGAGFLLYVLLGELIDSFDPAMELVGERVEELERRSSPARRSRATSWPCGGI